MTDPRSACEPLRDSDIRTALARRVAKQQRGREFLFVPEIDVWGGWPGRIDQVLITRRQIHGFEIKSDVDTLRRLPVQVQAYSPVLERATLVTTTRHLEAARSVIPRWWGILIASRGRDGSVRIAPLRAPRANPELDVFQVTTFVSRELIVKHIRAQGVRGTSRHDVYSLRQLLVVGALLVMERPDWRHRKGAVTQHGIWTDPTDSKPRSVGLVADPARLSSWLHRRIAT